MFKNLYRDCRPCHFTKLFVKYDGLQVSSRDVTVFSSVSIFCCQSAKLLYNAAVILYSVVVMVMSTEEAAVDAVAPLFRLLSSHDARQCCIFSLMPVCDA